MGGDIAKSIGSGGSLLGGIGNYLTKGEGEVEGTGHTLQELKDAGMTDEQAKLLPQGGFTTGQKLTRGIVGAGLGGLQGMNRQQQQRPQGGGAAPISIAPAPVVPTNYDPNYLLNWQQYQQLQPGSITPQGYMGNPSAFYGR